MSTVVPIATPQHPQGASRETASPDAFVRSRPSSNRNSSVSLSHMHACFSSESLACSKSQLGPRTASMLNKSLAEVEISTESLRRLSSATLLSSTASSESDGDQHSSTPGRRILSDADACSDKGGDSGEDDFSSDDGRSSIDVDEEALVFVAERKRIDVTRQPLSATSVSFAKREAAPTTRANSIQWPMAVAAAAAAAAVDNVERAQPSDVPTEAYYTNDESSSHRSQQSSSFNDADEIRLYHSAGREVADAKLAYITGDVRFMHHVGPATHVDNSTGFNEQTAVEGVDFELLAPEGQGKNALRESQPSRTARLAESISQSTFAMAGWSLEDHVNTTEETQEAISPHISDLFRKSSFSSLASTVSRSFADQHEPRDRQDSALVQAARVEEQRKEAEILARSSMETMSSGTLWSPTSPFPVAGALHELDNGNVHEDINTSQQDRQRTLVRTGPRHPALGESQQWHSSTRERVASLAKSIGASSDVTTSSQSIRTLRKPEAPLMGRSPAHSSSHQADFRFTKEDSVLCDEQSPASKKTGKTSKAEKAGKLKNSASKADLDWDGELETSARRSKKGMFGRSRRTSQTSANTVSSALGNLPSFGRSGGQPKDTLHVPTNSSTFDGGLGSHAYQQGPPSPAVARPCVTAPNTPVAGDFTSSMSTKQRSTTIGRWSEAINISRGSRSSVRGSSHSTDYPLLPDRVSVATPQPQSMMKKERNERPNYPPSSSQTRPTFNRSPSMESTTPSVESSQTNSSGKRSLLSRMGFPSRRSVSSSRGSISGSSLTQVGHSDDQLVDSYPSIASSPRQRESESGTEVIQDRSNYSITQQDDPDHRHRARGKPSPMRRLAI